MDQGREGNFPAFYFCKGPPPLIFTRIHNCNHSSGAFPFVCILFSDARSMAGQLRSQPAFITDPMITWKTPSLIFSVILFQFAPAVASAQQQPAGRQEITPHSMGSSVFELYAKSACAEGRPDAVDHALREAFEGADLLPDQAVEMRRGIRDAHAALMSKGGCAGFGAEEIARIRANQQGRTSALIASGGEMELELPAGLGGKATGAASYGTVAIEGTPFSVICLNTRTGDSNAVKLVILSPSPTMLREGQHDLADLNGTARLTVSSSSTNPALQYAILSIDEPEGNVRSGSLTGFLREGMAMLRGSFTAVPSGDPCGIRAELAALRN